MRYNIFDSTLLVRIANIIVTLKREVGGSNSALAWESRGRFHRNKGTSRFDSTLGNRRFDRPFGERISKFDINIWKKQE